MVIEASLSDQPKIQQGPEVGGQATIATIFSVEQLKKSNYLQSLVEVINVSFKRAHTVHADLRISTGDRIGSIDQFFVNLIDDPESFILIISHPESSTVIATASARRYHGPPKDSDSPWARRLPVEQDAEEWELKLMATHPSAQGCGIATLMMDMTEKEVISRFEDKMKRAEFAAVRRLRMVLCTPREILGEYYAKRGYQKDYENFRGEGFTFHIIFMSKVLYTVPAESSNSTGH